MRLCVGKACPERHNQRAYFRVRAEAHRHVPILPEKTVACVQSCDDGCAHGSRSLYAGCGGEKKRFGHRLLYMRGRPSMPTPSKRRAIIYHKGETIANFFISRTPHFSRKWRQTAGAGCFCWKRNLWLSGVSILYGII